MKKLLEEPASVAPSSVGVAPGEYGGTTQKEQLESFLVQMFRKHGVCNVQFLKQHLAERQKDKGRVPPRRT